MIAVADSGWWPSPDGADEGWGHVVDGNDGGDAGAYGGGRVFLPGGGWYDEGASDAGGDGGVVDGELVDEEGSAAESDPDALLPEPAMGRTRFAAWLLVLLAALAAGFVVVSVDMNNHEDGVYWQWGCVWEALFPAFLGLFPLVRGLRMLVLMRRAARRAVDGVLVKRWVDDGYGGLVFLPVCSYRSPDGARGEVNVCRPGLWGTGPGATGEDWMPDVPDGASMRVDVARGGRAFLEANRGWQAFIAVMNTLFGLALVAAGGAWLAWLARSGMMAFQTGRSILVDLFPLMWAFPYGLAALWMVSQKDRMWGDELPWEHWKWFLAWTCDEQTVVTRHGVGSAYGETHPNHTQADGEP